MFIKRVLLAENRRMSSLRSTWLKITVLIFLSSFFQFADLYRTNPELFIDRLTTILLCFTISFIVTSYFLLFCIWLSSKKLLKMTILYFDACTGTSYRWCGYHIVYHYSLRFFKIAILYWTSIYANFKYPWK